MNKLGKYEILEEAGRGGFAVVYKARDTELDRIVALKVLHPQLTIDPRFIERFRREAQVAAGLHHPHIVTVYEVGEEAGQHYLAMTFLPGRTLDKWLAQGPIPMSVEQAISVVEQIAGALDRIHEQGLVHRDVNPGNIMVDDAGQATLLDFGIVRAAEGTRLTTTMAVLGTPEYMAPEQAELAGAAEIDWRADIYALGVVAYEMLVGCPPFTGRSPTAVLHKQVYEPPPAPTALNPDLPPGLGPALLEALAKRRQERFQRAGAFAAELRRALMAESQMREREAQLAALYERLQAAAAEEDWAEVLTLGGQIRALDASYRDVPELMERARAQMRRPSRRPMPAWGWWAAAGGAILAVLLGLGVALGPRLWDAISAPTGAPAGLPTEPPTEEAAQEPGTTWTRPIDGMVMVHVPGGTFQMGSDEADPDADEDEFPQHSVTLDGFWIDWTEVTNAQYRQCVEAGACQAPTTCDWGEPTYEEAAKADHPVVCVDWYGAAAYCEWAGARLPTEAEWEYAARGLDGLIYPWGDSPPDNTLLNYAFKADGTTGVGSYPDGASWCKALDMAGNAWEWGADWYGGYPSEAQTNPVGSAAGDHRVVRGGGWSDGHEQVRTASRYKYTPGSRYHNVGFRCAGQPGDVSTAASTEAPTEPPTEVPTAIPTEAPTELPTEEPTLEPAITGTRPADGMVMVYVPGGTFQMGSDEGDISVADDEFPQHSVILDGFWIDQTEVTNAQYGQCVEAGACQEPTTCDWGEPTYGDVSKQDHPVVCVSWDAAHAYCEWVGARLATEAEWEYAARGLQGFIYPWGDDFDCSRGNFDDETKIDDDVVPGGEGCDGYERMAPVGSFPGGTSWCDAMDMAGNVWEWVADWYGGYPSDAQTNPVGPTEGDHKVLRGGGWDSFQGGVRAAYRSGLLTPYYRGASVGFRCVGQPGE